MVNHIFYGAVNKKQPYSRTIRLNFKNIESNADYRGFLKSPEIQKLQDSVRNPESHARFVVFTEKVEDKNIATKHDIEVLNIGDKIVIGDKIGEIESREYNVDTNTYHYYTDIEVKLIDEHVEKEKERIHKKIKEEAQRILDTYPHEKEKKSFWKNLFRKSE